VEFANLIESLLFCGNFIAIRCSFGLKTTAGHLRDLFILAVYLDIFDRSLIPSGVRLKAKK
jgi:hypothetical protein